MTSNEIIMKLATLAHQSLSRQQGEVDAYEELISNPHTPSNKAINIARDKAASVDSAPLQSDYEYYMGYADGLENARYWLNHIKNKSQGIPYF